jgi:antitoxin MazE
MKTRLVQMGNSRGVRLPKPLIEQAGLTEEVELEVRDNTIVIIGKKRVRAGWAEAAMALNAKDGDRLLDEPTPTRFEETEWQW